MDAGGPTWITIGIEIGTFLTARTDFWPGAYWPLVPYPYTHLPPWDAPRSLPSCSLTFQGEIISPDGGSHSEVYAATINLWGLQSCLDWIL